MRSTVDLKKVKNAKKKTIDLNIILLNFYRPEGIFTQITSLLL